MSGREGRPQAPTSRRSQGEVDGLGHRAGGRDRSTANAAIRLADLAATRVTPPVNAARARQGRDSRPGFAAAPLNIRAPHEDGVDFHHLLMSQTAGHATFPARIPPSPSEKPRECAPGPRGAVIIMIVPIP
jgi:hypothetical protein